MVDVPKDADDDKGIATTEDEGDGQMSKNDRDDRACTTELSKVWEILMKATVPLSVIIGSALVTHEVRIAKLEESRFTGSDGVKLERDIRAYVQDSFPPNWLREDIQEIKASMKSIEGRLRKIEMGPKK